MTRYRIAFALWLGLPVLAAWVLDGGAAYRYPAAGMAVQIAGTALLMRLATRGLHPDRLRAEQGSWGVYGLSAVLLFYMGPMVGLFPLPAAMGGSFRGFTLSSFGCTVLAIVLAAPVRRGRALMLLGELGALAAHWFFPVLWLAWIGAWSVRRPFATGREFTPAHLQAMHAVALAGIVAFLFGEVMGYRARRRLRESEDGLLDLRDGAEALYRTVAADAAARLAPGTPSALRLRELGGAIFLAGSTDFLLLLTVSMVVFDAAMSTSLVGGAASGEICATFVLALAALLASRRVCLLPLQWGLALFGLVYGVERWGPGVFRPGAGVVAGVIGLALAWLEMRRRGAGTLIVEGGGRAVAYRVRMDGSADPIGLDEARRDHEPFHHIELARAGADGVRRGALDPSPALIAFTCTALAFVVATVRVTERFCYASDNGVTAMAAWSAGDPATVERVCAATLAGAPDEPLALALLAGVRAAERRYDEAGALLERAWRGGTTGGWAGTYVGLGRANLFIRRLQIEQGRERWRKGERDGAVDEEQCVARHVVREMARVRQSGGLTGLLPMELAAWERVAEKR